MLFFVYGTVPSIVFALLDTAVLGVLQVLQRAPRGWIAVVKAGGLDVLLVVFAWILTLTMLVLR